jgi:hypothetical protein
VNRPLSIVFLLALAAALAAFLWDTPRKTSPGPSRQVPDKKNTPTAPAPSNATPAATARDHKPGDPRRRNELGQALPFREEKPDPATLARLRTAMPGDAVELVFFGDTKFRGTVGWRSANPGDLRLSGTLANLGARDRFFLSDTAEGGRLLVEIPSRNLAYEIEWDRSNPPTTREWLLTDVVCATPMPTGAATEGIPRPEYKSMRTAAAERIAPADVPIINTRPGAPDVIYMDFDGEMVTSSAWASGATIVAPAARLNASQIREVISRMERDFEGFNVNITTQRSVFDATSRNSRIQCVVTDNDQAAPGAGGVAYTDSFSSTNESFKVCWAFIDTSAKDCAEVASHEVGHTLGLDHDGRNASGNQPREEYYEGHGAGATGWAPIMGVGYYRQLTQWSKGEYERASNQEDDLAVMTRLEMLSYLPDTAGNSTATSLAITGDRADGSIERTGDVDVFQINLPAGNHSINLLPAPFTNLDGELVVVNFANATLTTANPIDQTGATASFFLASNQTIYLRVTGSGKSGMPAAGYSAYGSLGTYSLTGFGNQQQPPSSPTGLSTTRISGTQIRVSWMPNPSATSYTIYRNGSLIGTTSGTEFLDTAATPGTETSYTVIASNSFGQSPSSEASVVLTPAADEFVMDGGPDFSGYLLSNPGMTIYAALRGNRLYVATWSPGDNNSGFGSDHFVLISDSILTSASTSAPWSKAGRIAIPSIRPFLAGESAGTYAGWLNAQDASPILFKSPVNSGVLEGSIDLVAAFGSIPENIYIASVAYATEDGGGINSQAPSGNSNNDIEPSEFLRIPVASIRDRALNGTYDILDPARSFRPKSMTFDSKNQPVLVWDVLPGKRYFVYRNTDLSSNSWTLLNAGGWNADPGQWEMIFTDTDLNPGPRQFYRVTTP